MDWRARPCSSRVSTFDEVGTAFGGLALGWMVPVLLFGCINLWLRAVRWGVLLAPVAPLPTAQLLGVGISAALAGLSLPTRGGDAVKVFLAIRLPGVKLTDVAAAELLERAGGRPDLRQLHLAGRADWRRSPAGR